MQIYPLEPLQVNSLQNLSSPQKDNKFRLQVQRLFSQFEEKDHLQQDQDLKAIQIQTSLDKTLKNKQDIINNKIKKLHDYNLKSMQKKDEIQEKSKKELKQIRKQFQAQQEQKEEHLLNLQSERQQRIQEKNQKILVRDKSQKQNVSQNNLIISRSLQNFYCSMKQEEQFSQLQIKNQKNQSLQPVIIHNQQVTKKHLEQIQLTKQQQNENLAKTLNKLYTQEKTISQYQIEQKNINSKKIKKNMDKLNSKRDKLQEINFEKQQQLKRIQTTQDEDTKEVLERKEEYSQTVRNQKSQKFSNKHKRMPSLQREQSQTIHSQITQDTDERYQNILKQRLELKYLKNIFITRYQISKKQLQQREDERKQNMI